DPRSGEIADLDAETGALTYTPSEGFIGTDRFTFKANDGSADSNTAEVTIMVTNSPEGNGTANSTIASPSSSRSNNNNDNIDGGGTGDDTAGSDD
ncbi:MAG: cadherin-like domain-containing protein, partial [Thermoproteota archaeon]|nr:cadherin-like domain-containing protein [Thermoproteota archaeon]